jgi:hypothetical protein
VLIALHHLMPDAWPLRRMATEADAAKATPARAQLGYRHMVLSRGSLVEQTNHTPHGVERHLLLRARARARQETLMYAAIPVLVTCIC